MPQHNTMVRYYCCCWGMKSRAHLKTTLDKRLATWPYSHYNSIILTKLHGRDVSYAVISIREAADLLGLREKKPVWSVTSTNLGKAKDAQFPPPGAHYHEEGFLLPWGESDRGVKKLVVLRVRSTSTRFPTNVRPPFIYQLRVMAEG